MARVDSARARALRIRREVLGLEHPDTADSLNGLAVYFAAAGDYAKAPPLLQQAVEISRKVLGPEHPDPATSISNLAGLYSDAGEYSKALPLHRQALDIRRKVFGLENPAVAESLDALGVVYQEMNDWARALPVQRQALEVYRRLFGPELALYHHPQWLEHPELIGAAGGQRCADFSKRVGPGSPRRPAASPEAAPRGLPPKYWAAFVLSGSGQ